MYGVIYQRCKKMSFLRNTFLCLHMLLLHCFIKCTMQNSHLHLYFLAFCVVSFDSLVCLLLANLNRAFCCLTASLGRDGCWKGRGNNSLI